jgi:hypothetical protein
MKRRAALGVLGGGVGAGFPMIIGAKRARAAVPLDPSKPEDLHLIHRKLNFTFDDRLVFWLGRAKSPATK